MDDGVEPFVSVSIGKEILKESRNRWGTNYPYGGYVSLETSIKRLKHYDYLNNIEDNILGGRIDVTYWDANEKVCGIVEVKRWFDKSTYPKDIRRIGLLLRHNGPTANGTLRYGCFAFILQQQKRQTIENRIISIQNNKQEFQEISGCICEIRTSDIKSMDSDGYKIAGVAVVFKAP